MEDFIKSAAEGLKSKVMNDFKDIKKEREKHAETIVRNHVLFSMGAGAIPVPVADVLAVSASQLDMIRQLCKVYDMDFHESQGKAIVSALTASTLARIGAGSLAKFIPVVGSVVAGVTNALMAGASTYALGQVFKTHFDTGGTILDFDPGRLKKLYKEQFEKGKKVAEELAKQKEAKQKAEEAAAAAEAPAAADLVPDTPPVAATPKSSNSEADVITRLKELGELKAGGIITEEEFEKMKKRILK
ncbi:MAG: DUF697 domain-containing protein [Saprospiraceae bacterium]|nr:DUF697 domain-containing protein [Saprospiraceae bacterium]